MVVDRNYPSAIIFEDDVRLVHNFKQQLEVQYSPSLVITSHHITSQPLYIHRSSDQLALLLVLMLLLLTFYCLYFYLWVRACVLPTLPPPLLTPLLTPLLHQVNLHHIAQGNHTYDVVLLGAIGRVHPEGKDHLGTR